MHPNQTQPVLPPYEPHRVSLNTQRYNLWRAVTVVADAKILENSKNRNNHFRDAAPTIYVPGQLGIGQARRSQKVTHKQDLYGY